MNTLSSKFILDICESRDVQQQLRDIFLNTSQLIFKKFRVVGFKTQKDFCEISFNLDRFEIFSSREILSYLSRYMKHLSSVIARKNFDVKVSKATRISDDYSANVYVNHLFIKSSSDNLPKEHRNLCVVSVTYAAEDSTLTVTVEMDFYWSFLRTLVMSNPDTVDNKMLDFYMKEVLGVIDLIINAIRLTEV